MTGAAWTHSRIQEEEAFTIFRETASSVSEGEGRGRERSQKDKDEEGKEQGSLAY